MDKNQLETIAITAAFTILFRELFAWIVSFAKLTAIKPATKERARKMFRIRNIYLAINGLWLFWAIRYLIRMARATTPVTHVEVLSVSFYVLSIFVTMATVIFTLSTMAALRKTYELKELGKIGQPFMRETHGGPVE